MFFVMILGLLLASGGHYDLFSYFCLCGHIVISCCFTSYDKCTYCKWLWMKASKRLLNAINVIVNISCVFLCSSFPASRYVCWAILGLSPEVHLLDCHVKSLSKLLWWINAENFALFFAYSLFEEFWYWIIILDKLSLSFLSGSSELFENFIKHKFLRSLCIWVQSLE